MSTVRAKAVRLDIPVRMTRRSKVWRAGEAAVENLRWWLIWDMQHSHKFLPWAPACFALNPIDPKGGEFFPDE